jgi:hypothetical protein
MSAKTIRRPLGFCATGPTVEGGLGLYLRRGDSPTDGYRLAAAYCEHYDPRYGTGFNGPSAVRIEEIADFVLAIETYEQTGSKLPFLQS